MSLRARRTGESFMFDEVFRRVETLLKPENKDLVWFFLQSSEKTTTVTQQISFWEYQLT